MALVRHERFPFDWPERWRRLLELESDLGGWLRVEEFRDGDDMLVRVELPGIDPEHDVEVTVTDGVLHIQGRREERTERKEKGGYRSEFRYGGFVRDVALPAGVKDEDVKATYADGILEVRVPLPAEPKASATKIPVSRG